MRFAVLGPLAIASAGGDIPLSSSVQRTLLAMLLLHANKPVSADLLAEVVWDGRPPATARTGLQNHVMRLRRTLGTSIGPRLVTRAPGYLLEVHDGELDLTRFTGLRDSGHAAARQGAWHDAARMLGAALGQWTGEPIAGVRASTLLAAEAQRLTELRLQTFELRIEADLRCGHHCDVIGELQSASAEHPLRERLRAQLMLALYLDGRQAEALGVYQDLRRTLVKEFGIEPERAIQRLHQQILAADPALTQAWPGNGEQPAADHVVPRQLPSALSSFVARNTELAQLTRWLDRPADTPVIVVCGSAGVGKTALAVHWAHQVAALFRGGQLHLDLRGFSPAGEPLTLAEAVRSMLAALGVADYQVPASVQAQVGLYRSLLADRERTLIVLDNARDAEQVRPLLPGAPGCLTVVTSRADMAELAAVEGARTLTLGVLSGPEARQLLVGRLGADLADKESGGVDELSVLCARLPLALAIAAARALLPGVTLAHLVLELRDTRSRLDGLDIGEQSSIRTVFSWSYRLLSRPAARMFRLLGIQQGPDMNVWAAASLAGVPVDQAGHLLAELTRLQLLTRNSPARFGFHDLLRAYAAERAEDEEDPVSRRAALRRLFDHYLHTGSVASRLLYPARDPLALDPPSDRVILERLADDQQALAWFEAEYEGLLAAVYQSGTAGFGVHAWQLAWYLAVFQERRGYWSDYARVQRVALAAASGLDDMAGVARANRNLGTALIHLGRRADARAHVLAARDVCRDMNDQTGEARVTLDLPWFSEQEGNYPEALAQSEYALSLFTAIGHRAGQGRALNVVGWYSLKMGDVRRGINLCEQAVALCAELGDQVGEAAAWDSQGYGACQLGDFPKAIACYRHAIELTRLIGDRYHHAEVLVHVGDAHQVAKDLSAAHRAWQDALVILDELRHPDGEDVRRKLARTDEG